MVAIDHSGPAPVSNQAQTLDALSERERAVLGWLRTRLTARFG
jgi:hypothetical protein